MIANALFITIALLPALVFWLMGELPDKLVLWREYATPRLPTSFTWPLTCLVPPSFSSASSSSRTPGENSPISTNSFTRVGPRCQRLGLKRSPIEMPRGYELEDFLTPRDVSEGREPTSEPSSRDQVAREQAADDRSPVAARTTIETQLLPLSPGRSMKYRGALTASETLKPQRWWNLANSLSLPVRILPSSPTVGTRGACGRILKI